MLNKYRCACLLILLFHFPPAHLSASNLDSTDMQFEEISDDSRIDPFENPIDIEKGKSAALSFFGKPLFLFIETQFDSEFMGNYKLGDSASGDTLEVEPALSLALLYRLGEKTTLFLENELQYHYELMTERDPSSEQWVFERVESWILFQDIIGSGISLQLGRQTYEDERQWWWDEQLDSVRLHFDRGGVHSEIAVARELAAESNEKDIFGPEDKDILRFLGQTVWGNNEEMQYGLFALYQLDRSNQPQIGNLTRASKADEIDADLFWYGGRMTGAIDTEDVGAFFYWIDAAGVTGNETQFEFEKTENAYLQVTDIIKRDVSGWGYDVGINWETGRFNDMVLSLGYAWGSGDRNPDDQKNNSFRQTGLNEGDQRFQYYGELLNPDLSNLQIVTASIGFPLGPEGFIDFIYHNYRQDHPADFLWRSDLEADPEGVRTFIGEEWNIAFTFEGKKGLEIETSAAYFKAGNAFGDLSNSSAYRLKFEINYLF